MAGPTPLKILINEVKTLSLAHDQVRSFRYGLFLDVITESAIDYTLVHLYVRQAPKSNDSKTFILELAVMDRVDEGNKNLVDVESNTLQIWQDIYDAIQYSPRWQDVGVIDTNVIAQKFLHKGKDRVTGWGADIPLEIYGGAGYCESPFFGYDFNDTSTPSTTENEINFKGLFIGTDEEFPEITIDADNAGTYTSISDDGGSGSIELNINSGGYGAFVNPTTLSVGDTFQVRRTTFTADGFFKLTGTF